MNQLFHNIFNKIPLLRFNVLSIVFHRKKKHFAKLQRSRLRLVKKLTGFSEGNGKSKEELIRNTRQFQQHE